jgi:putative ABC transport system substrate-binding protein
MSNTAIRFALCIILLTLTVSAHAQQTKKIPRIGYLAAGSPPVDKAFLQGLRDLGYIEGQSIAIEYRFADGKNERLPGLAAELIGLKVDIIVTAGTPAAVAAKQATSMIPVVMAIVADPVGEGLVGSLARPGGTSPGWLTWTQSLAKNGWRSSKKSFPGSLGWPSSGTPPIRHTDQPWRRVRSRQRD